MAPITDYELECCGFGQELADFGLVAGTWSNGFVAAMATELLEARRKLRELGVTKEGEHGSIQR